MLKSSRRAAAARWRQELEQNAEQGGGAALVEEDLNEKSKNTSKNGMKSKHRGAAGASDAAKALASKHDGEPVELVHYCSVYRWR